MTADNPTNAPMNHGDDMAFLVLRRLLRTVHEEWGELGDPGERTTDEASVFAFTARKDVELLLGAFPRGTLQVGLKVAPKGPHITTEAFTRLLDCLEERWQWSAEQEKDVRHVCVSTRLDSAEMGVMEEARFRSDLLELKRWCDTIRPLASARYDDAALRKAYKGLENVLTPLLPWPRGQGTLPAGLAGWAAEVLELLRSGLPVGLVGVSQLERRLALVLLAEGCLDHGTSLAGLALPGISPSKLIQIAEKAPGFMAVPARSLEMGANPYELGKAVANLLSTLGAAATPCVFDGTHPELQAVFNGGQGAESDPLCPVVCHVPDFPLEVLAGFALHDLVTTRDLSAPTNPEALVAEVLQALAGCPPASARRLLPYVMEHGLTGAAPAGATTPFVDKLDARKETFGALSAQARGQRSPEVQARLLNRLIDGAFRHFLGTHLIGQDEALDAYNDAIQREALTRAGHQPLALAFQGPPGTGKSEGTMSTAEFLDVPHVVIDAASMPDPHTATSQLLGSGRGIVGSYQAGRLEEVARHHTGAVVEIADIDHAVPSVRSALGDLFLQIMQTGEAQSAVGATFSCANLLLIFTLNLPDGKDEKAFRRTGFGAAPSMSDVRKDVRREMKNMISGAFLSRIGEPILFAPLTGEARVTIFERAIAGAVGTGLARMGITGARIAVPAGMGARLTSHLDGSAITFGARGLVDLARGHAARALVAWRAANANSAGPHLQLVLNDQGAVEIAPGMDPTEQAPPPGGKGA